MEKPELIAAVAKETNIPEDQVSQIVESFVNEIKEGLAKGDKVTIAGFGTFLLARRRATTFINPKTKQKYDIPERMLPQFRPGTNFQT